MSGWRLRPGRHADLERLWAIESRAHAFPWSRSLLADSLDRAGAAWVVEDADARVLGYAVLSVAADEAELFNIAIEPQLRRRGIGRFLLAAVMAEARRQGARCCFLEVRTSNQAALTLYRRAGFVEVGRRRDYYPTRLGREDACVLRLDLAEGGTACESCTR